MLDALNNRVTKYLPPGVSIFWFWQGRVALYAILKSMGVKHGDEIIVPAYTCVVVPNAIIYLGAKPVYVDINTKTYNIESSKIEEVISPRTKVILCQNTYGLSSNIEFILDIAKRHNLYTVEDCTHGFGGTYNGNPNGSYCDAAFYSTQWNKPFSTGLGGFAVTKSETIKRGLQIQYDKMMDPSFKERFMLKALYFFKNNIINDITYWPMIRIYRWLSKHNFVLGSSKGQEIEGVKMPNGYLKKFCGTQIKQGLKSLSSLENLLIIRKRNATIYSAFLKANDKNYVDESLFKNHSFLKYPLLVKDRDRFFFLAQMSKISLGDWFVSPLHPVKDHNLCLWSFNKKDFPVAVYASEHVVNLPTDIESTDAVISFLEKNLSEIL